MYYRTGSNGRTTKEKVILLDFLFLNFLHTDSLILSSLLLVLCCFVSFLQWSLTAIIFAYTSLLIDAEYHPFLCSPSVLPVLKSFVNIERTLLQYMDHYSVEVSDKEEEHFELSKTTRRVRFCPFSSISPLTDTKH